MSADFKDVLTDDAAWAVATMDNESWEAAYAWLIDCISGVMLQITTAKADHEAFLADRHAGDEIRDAKRQYAHWRASALHFKSLCEKRKRQMDNEKRARRDDSARKVVDGVRSIVYHSDPTCCEHCDEWRRDLLKVLTANGVEL